MSDTKKTEPTIETLRELATQLLSQAEAKVSAAQAMLDQAMAELLNVQAAAGIVPTKPESKKATAAAHFIFVKDTDATGHAASIMSLIKAAGTNGISREALLTQMETIVTKMKRSTMLSFYQKQLIDGGFVSVK